MNMAIPFPLVIPVNEEKGIYKGYITIKNKEYFIQVQLGKEGKLAGSKELEQLVTEQLNTIKAKLHESTNIQLFLTELKEILESNEAVSKLTTFKCSSERYQRIYNEITSIGFDRVHTLNDTMDEIIFQYTDEEKRVHLLKIILPVEYPFIPPKVHYELPTSFTVTNSIAAIYNEFQTLVKKYQPLFHVLDDLDAYMKIIEPDERKRSDTFRKIALGYHCSLYIDFGPDYSVQKGKPTNIRFFGNLSRVQALKSKWKSYIWDKHVSMHVNLLNMFQISQNDKQVVEEDYTNTSDLECGICYSYKLDKELPEVICSNTLCNRGFHSLCLYEWLRSNPSTTTSFNILFGQCPYCNEKITIKAIIH